MPPTCEEVGQVGVEAPRHVQGAPQQEEGVVIAVEQPLEAVPQVPARMHAPAQPILDSLPRLLGREARARHVWCVLVLLDAVRVG